MVNFPVVLVCRSVCWWYLRVTEKRVTRVQTWADHRHHRAGRQLPRRVAARQGLRGPRHRPPVSTETSSASTTCRERIQLPPGRPARPALAHRRRQGDQAGRGLQPRGPELRADAAGSSRCSPASSPRSASRGCSRRSAQLAPRDSLLPGVVERDVRQGPRGAADRGRRRSIRAARTAWPRSTATGSR